MPFIRRDSTGKIMALFREQTAEALDYLPSSHPEVMAFIDDAPLADEGSRSHRLAEQAPGEGRWVASSDLEMIRVYEDLVDILISKHVVVLTDFPQAAQEKLMRRKRLRALFSSLTDAVAAEDEDGFFRI